MSVDAILLTDKNLQIGLHMSSPFIPFAFLLVVGVLALVMSGKKLKDRLGSAAFSLGLSGLIFLPLSAIVAMETDGYAVYWLYAAVLGCAMNFFLGRLAVKMKEN
jgi:hypothetical protein